MHSPVVIIGSGPAAHTAAIYVARAFLKPVMFEGFMANGMAAGGQLTTTTDVENYPGFPDGIQGPELMERMRQQSLNSGCEIVTETVVTVDFRKRPFRVESETGRIHTADAIIIGTGATAKRLFLPGEDRFWQKGVSACAVCDGPAPIFRNKPLVVIGGGDSASEEATFLSKYASKVYVLVRRNVLRASTIMSERLKTNKKVTILFNTVAERIEGTKTMEKVLLRNVVTGERSWLQASGLFYAIGHEPNTKIFAGQIDLDDNGYIVTGQTTETNVPGVFACGDVQDFKYRQAVTAAGSGCMAALDAERFLSKIS